MIFHDRRFSCNIIPNFCRKLGKVSQNLSSSAVVIGALRVKLTLLLVACLCMLENPETIYTANNNV